MQLTELVKVLDGLLQPSRFQDYCPNGLQVQGRSEVRTLVTGVTASQALLDAALAMGADAVLVHHGYFWKGESPVVTGIKRQRLATLLAADVSLLAYHLPLDAHADLGNNAQLAKRMGWQREQALFPQDARSVGDVGQLPVPVSADVLGHQLADVLGRMPQHIPGRSAQIHRLAWCTGAAQGFIEQAVAMGVDAYVSGEISEQTVHVAREAGIHYWAIGHHASERYGVQAVGEWCARELGLTHHFIDCPNPV